MIKRSAILRLQRGQAMVEALIASALVLVPLFLAIPVIAKYMDIKSSAVQAARYAAWERTVWYGGDAAATSFSSNKWDANAKTDTIIRKEIGKRLLSDNNDVAFTNSDTSGGAPRRFWNDRLGNGLLQPYDESNSLTAGGNASGTGNNISPGIMNDLLSPLMNVTSVVSNFTLDTNAEYTAQVALNVQQVAYNTGAALGGCTNDAADPTSCQGIQDFIATGTKMSFSEKNVLVANGWSANGPGSLADYGSHPERITVYNQTRGLTPASLLKPAGGAFKTFLNVLQDISLVLFPELSTLDLGRIEVDKVPADRLKN